MTSRYQWVATEAATSPLTPVTDSGTWTYAYDGAGNRTSVRVGTGTPVTTTYDAAGLPVSSSDGTAYTHDAVGDLTSVDRTGTANDWFFTYGSWSQLTKAARTASGSDVTYTLDALDRVLSRTAGGTTTSYTYSGIGEVLAKAAVGTTTTATYASTPSGPLAEKVVSGRTTTTRYYLSDPHGDVVGVADTSAALKGTVLYDAWGQVLSSTGDLATVPAQGAFRFQSDLADATTGQVDMGARLYEPTLGRFSSRDLLFGDPAAPVSLNQFAYGLDSPVTFSDPTGLGACTMPNECSTYDDQGRRHTHGGNPGAAAYDPSVEGITSAVSPGVVPPQNPAYKTVLLRLRIAVAVSSLFSMVSDALQGASEGAKWLAAYYRAIAWAKRGNIQIESTAEAAAVTIERSLLVSGSQMLRGAGWILVAVDASLGYAKRRAEGQGPYEAAVRQGLQTGGGLGGALGGAAVGGTLGTGCGPLAPLCVPAGMVVGTVVGGLAGSWAGDVTGRSVFDAGTGPTPLSVESLLPPGSYSGLVQA